MLSSWKGQLGWVDPISLGKKGVPPFLSAESAWLGLVSPSGLAASAVVVAIVATVRKVPRDRLGWAVLAGLLIVGGALTPDTLGPAHGNYLPQRVVLIGLMALASVIVLDLSRAAGKLASGLLVAALLLQSLSVWDYARESDRRVSPFLRVGPAIGRGQRVGTLLVNIRGKFRANPVLHADNLAGLGTTGHVVWSNYETAHYYFPVQVRPGLPHPPAEAFEAIAIRDAPADATARASAWKALLDAHHDEIDVLLVWGEPDPALSAENARWFDPRPVFADGPLRAFRHRPRPGS